MDHVLAQLLHERVFGNLQRLEALTAAQEPAPGAVAPEAHRLIAAWRTLLSLHETTESGACKACGPRWRKHMCSVWRVATAYFIRHDHHYDDLYTSHWSDAGATRGS